ncbi:MAG: HD domain-containing protein [Candidatus Omnitrophica bacterium]|nr:HD domain-containing protein [Candidatus Omnitrophota bacterium]
MKYSKIKKITVCILIQVFLILNFSWAAQEGFSDSFSTHTLAPALQINNSTYFLPYYNVNVGVVRPWNQVAVVLKEQKKIDGYFNNTIDVSFKHDQVGIFSKILSMIGREGELISFEMVQGKERNMFRFEVTTKTKNQRKLIIDQIKEIKDLPQENHKRVKKQKWVLTISASAKGDALREITAYLASFNINVSKFLTPKQLGEGKAEFAFELDIPRYSKIQLLEAELNTLGNNVQISKGQLVDRVLDDFLISEINVNINKKSRLAMRSAIKIVADRHMSQARKDGRMPFLMHPVEIAKIISNELNMFDPDLLAYFSESLNNMEKEEVVLTILMATLLHDAVEDGDITQEKLDADFSRVISTIVKLVTKLPDQRDKQGEAVYLNNLLKKGKVSKIIRQIAQIIKIADRIHNLRTLKYNSPEFQRKVIFSTIDNFLPHFIDKINTKEIKNEYMKALFTRTIELFEQQLLMVLKDLDIDPQQRIQYEWEEQCRLNPKVLRLAEQNNLIAHGVSLEKGGRDRLFSIMEQGYISAKPIKLKESAESVDLGMVVFAGVLRPQRSDENHDDYQAESPGDYKPFYVVLNSEPEADVQGLRITREIAKRNVILPGLYRAIEIDPDKGVWGIGSDLHMAYLVPAHTDRQELTRKMLQAVQAGKIDKQFALEAIAKIITYKEFLAIKGSLKSRSISAIKKKNITAFYAGFIDRSI